MIIYRPLRAFVVFLLIFCLVVPLGSAGAANGSTLPAFSDFLNSVVDGQANVVRGVYVPEILALRVMQQPGGDTTFVFRLDGIVTQFHAAAQNHVIGLLAHDDMAGASFAGLQLGQIVRIVYGNGRVEYYLVNRLASFQALQSGREIEQYTDVNSNITYSVQDIFTMFYAGAVHVTFQTCIQKNGNPIWGRFFVTAIPVPLIYYLQKSQEFVSRSGLDNQKLRHSFDFITGNYSIW